MELVKRILITSTSMLAVASAYCAQPTTRIWETTPAKWFEESFPIGNGTLGASVYNGMDADSMSLNDITLWTGEPIDRTRPYSPNASTWIPQIRAALDRGDFRAADSLQKFVQGKYSQNYQPLGKLKIYYHGFNPDNIYRELDINTGIATSITSSGNKIGRIVQTFCSAPDSVIVVNITCSKPQEITISLDSPESMKTLVRTSTSTHGYAAFDSRPIYSRGEGSFRHDERRGIHFLTLLDAECPAGGNIEYGDDYIHISNAPTVNLRLTNATSFSGASSDPAKNNSYIPRAVRRLSAAKERSYAELLARHRYDVSSLMERVSINLGETSPEISTRPTSRQLLGYTLSDEYNPELEALYFQFGRYLLSACSRTPGVPANLQGLWNEYVLPPWSSNYTTNINLQENYWPAENTNLSELHRPLLDFILMLSESTGKDAALIYYGVNRGWCLGQNSDIWGTAAPVGEHEGHPMWANWTMGGAWLASHIWEHYLYTLDKEDLKKYYPALRGAAEFCAGWMIEKDGMLITSPGTSPENRFIADNGYEGATAAGMTADIAIARQCISDALHAAKVLDTDHTLQNEFAGILHRLAPYKTGSSGLLLEWPEDWQDAEPTHRHQTHLYGLFPGRHLTPDDTPELVEAASKSLDLRGELTTGWSTGWRINLRARALDSEKAYSMLRRLLNYISPDGYIGQDARRGGGTYPNLLDAHSPFQIDGNFGGTSGIAEMIMQSNYSGLPGDTATIHIMPATPREWKNGHVRGLNARGGYTVDIVWENNRPTEVVATKNTPMAAPLNIKGAEGAKIIITE